MAQPGVVLGWVIILHAGSGLGGLGAGLAAGHGKHLLLCLDMLCMLSLLCLLCMMSLTCVMPPVSFKLRIHCSPVLALCVCLAYDILQLCYDTCLVQLL